jgi:hypothetical protein
MFTCKTNKDCAFMNQNSNTETRKCVDKSEMTPKIPTGNNLRLQLSK